MLQESKWRKAHQSHEPSKLQSLYRILGLHTYHCNKLRRGSNLHQIHQHGLIRDLSIRPKPVILIPSFSFLQELWEYRFGGWGVLSKGLRSCCHEPTVLLGERDVHWTRQLSSHGKSPKLTPCHPTPIRGEGEAIAKGEKRPLSETTTRLLQKPSQTIRDHHKVSTKVIPNHWKPPQGYYKNHHKPSETTTKSLQMLFQTIKPSQGHCKTIIIKPPQGHRKTIIIKSITSHHEITARLPSHTIKS